MLPTMDIENDLSVRLRIHFDSVTTIERFHEDSKYLTLMELSRMECLPPTGDQPMGDSGTAPAQSSLTTTYTVHGKRHSRSSE